LPLCAEDVPVAAAVAVGDAEPAVYVLAVLLQAVALSTSAQPVKSPAA